MNINEKLRMAMKTKLNSVYGKTVTAYQSSYSVCQASNKSRQDYDFKVLVDSEVIFATNDYNEALNRYTEIVNSKEPIYMYEVNLVLNLKWLSYTEQGEKVEGRYIL